MRIVYPWLRELVGVPDDPDLVAREISLRGFEIAAIDSTPVPVIDFEITANRPDCLSHVGLAREASAIWGSSVQLPDGTVPAAGPAETFDVRLEDATRCPRYCAQVFEVRPGQSPAWLTERLIAGGIRPISNIVDVTNYVMLEMGQPMHAFDLERLAERTLVIRCARAGERMRTLDGIERELDPEMLVIADAARPSAIGGVMGGQDSEIGPATRLIVLESAYFHPPSVRRTSKRLGLKTEASIRFERGADIGAPPVGIARVAALLSRIGCGTPRGPLIDRYPVRRDRTRLHLRAARIAHLLGLSVPDADVVRILEPLGFEVAPGPAASGPGWIVTVPSFRVDVSREADLIEEVGRHYGFERVPATFPPLTAPQAPPDPEIARTRLVRQILTAAGFSEAMSFTFIEKEAALPFCDDGVEPAPIENPLSEKFAVLRPTLLAGLLDACAYNRRRERKDVRLFESGSRFTQAGEGRAVALAWSGAGQRVHWSAPVRHVDFFDVKGVVEELCATFRVEADFVPAERRYLAAGRTAEVRVRSNGATSTLGVLGQIQPAVAEARGFPGAEEIYVAELDLGILAAVAPTDELRADPLPRFPSIVRDISILVDNALPAAAVRGTIRSAAPHTLVSVNEFDRYQGRGVPEGRVSLSIRLTFRATDRTLTDEEAQAATERIVEALRAGHGAEQR